MKSNRTRHIPTGSIVIKPKAFPTVQIAIQNIRIERTGQVAFYALAYSGKRTKADFHYRFDSAARREAYIGRYLQGLQASADAKAAQAARRQLDFNPCKVGDIFYSSWGYEQTNVDFYQVVEVKGMSVIIQEIQSEMVEGGQESGMSSNVVAIKDAFVKSAKQLKKRVQTYNGGDSVYLSMSHSNASIWDGKPKYSSWYA